MRYERTQHEQEQVNRAAVDAMRSSWRWERQNVYRLCPLGLYVDEAHFLRTLSRNDGTPRSIAAQKWAMATAGRSLGRSTDQLAAETGRPVDEVSRLLGPLPIWREGAELLRAIDDAERAVMMRERPEPPAARIPPGGTFSNANADGVRTPLGYWRNSGGRENRARE